MTEQCPNRTPLKLTDPNGNPRQRSACRECGGYLAILDGSGKFRTHKRVFQPGDPRIAERVESDLADERPAIKRYA